MPGLYIHIPFCAEKCRYCSFYSVTAASDDAVSGYLNTVTSEIAQHVKRSGIKPDTLYIGGGSPSLIAPDRMKEFLFRLSDTIDLSPVRESTVEANPESFSRAWFDALSVLPALRISMGVQSIYDRTLAVIGRRARAADFERALSEARNFGVRDLSVDLIIGLPGETARDTEAGLLRIISLAAPQHFSLYFLDLSGKKKLGHEWASMLPGDEANAACYRNAALLLAPRGYERYEVANFAKPGHRSRHNENYWALGEYIGAGASAAGFYRGRRYRNIDDVTGYRDRIERGDDAAAEEELLTGTMVKEEFIFLSLRTVHGIDRARYRERFGEDIMTKAGGVIAANARHIDADSERVYLTDEGFLFADEMAVLLMRSAGT